MNVRLILCGLLVFPFPRAAFAQEFLGTEKSLERVLSETAAARAGDEKKTPVALWLSRVEEYGKGAATLPAGDAATRWVALADEWHALPRKQIYGMDGRDLFALFKALPPPAAWDALDETVSARPRDGGGAPFDLGLKMLASGLRGDFGKVGATVKELKPAAAKGRRGQYFSNEIRKISEWIEARNDDPMAAVTRFEEELKTHESGEESGSFGVPDLVTLVGVPKAEALLKRAFLAGSAQVQIQVGSATKALAVKLATQLVAKLKKPQWRLIEGVSASEMALYEALQKKFPRKHSDENGDGDERDSAEAYYVIGLIEAKRTPEAAKLALARFERSGHEANFGSGVLALIRGGSVGPVRAFLRELLAKNPALPFWEDFISLSAQASESADALAFLRETAAREGLPDDARTHVREYLWSALLAAGEMEAGVKVLRETLDANLAAMAGAANKARRESNASESPGKLALRLLRIGRLLESPELIEAGLKAARAVIQSEANERYSSTAFATAELLSELGRGAEAEAMVIDSWVSTIKKRTPEQGRFDDDAPYLSALAEVYHRAGRQEDVLALLEKANGWGAGDLAEISGGGSLRYMTASALAATGRKDEARKLLLDLLEDQPGFDPAYELLMQIGGENLTPALDALLARERFEERPLIWKAKIQLDAGQLDDAEKTVRAAIAIDPSDGEQGKGTRMRAYAVLGDILDKKGDAAQAKLMRGAVEAIRLSENADDWWQAGLLTRAVKMYEEALGHFADAYCIQSRLSLRYADLGNFAKAEEHYRRAFELMPDSFGRIESHCFGCEHAFHGERAQGIAEKVFTTLAEKTPRKPQVFYLLGYLRAQQQRYAEAAESYRKAVSLDPDYFNAWSRLAGLSENIAIPRADREAAALNLLRLDPLGRHRSRSYGTSIGSTDSTISEISDFRALWKIVEAAAKIAPVRAAKIYPLPAATAELERRMKAEGENARTRRGRSSDGNESRDNTARSPGATLARHELISSIAQLLQGIVRADGAD